MNPTRASLLAVLGALAAAVGWAVTQLITRSTGQTFQVPWLASVTILVLALALFIWALLIRPRIQRKEGTRPLNPFVAARTAALAMAASRTGALVAGFYLGIAIDLLPRYFNDFARQNLWAALGAVGASILMILAALWLEHICRLPLDDDKDKKKSELSDPASDWVLPSHSPEGQPRNNRRH